MCDCYCSRLNRSVSWLTQNREFKEIRERAIAANDKEWQRAKALNIARSTRYSMPLRAKALAIKCHSQLLRLIRVPILSSEQGRLAAQNKNLRSLGKLKNLVTELRLCVYSDLGCCRKAVKEKIESNTQARLKVERLYFFISITRRVILNPHQHRRKTKFFRKFLHALLFSKSGQYCVAK